MRSPAKAEELADKVETLGSAILGLLTPQDEAHADALEAMRGYVDVVKLASLDLFRFLKDEMDAENALIDAAIKEKLKNLGDETKIH